MLTTEARTKNATPSNPIRLKGRAAPAGIGDLAALLEGRKNSKRARLERIGLTLGGSARTLAS